MAPPRAVQALVVTEQQRLRDSLADVLRETFDGAAIRSENTVELAIASVRRHGRAELVLFDFGLSGSSGLEALTRLRDKLPPCRIVACSAFDDRGLVLSALHIGAAGYLPKGSPRGVMIAALRLVAAGGIYLPPEVMPPLSRVPVNTRQRHVLRLLLKGYSNWNIAAKLGLPPSTVRQHTRAVFDSFGVSSRAQLAATVARNPRRPSEG